MTTKHSKESLDFLQSLIGKKTSLGGYLLAIRKDKELSQVQFATALGISKQNLCDIEHNRRFINPKRAAEFAEKIGYLPEHFVKLCLQDLLDRNGLDLSVDIRHAS